MDPTERKPITSQMLAAVIVHLAILQHMIMAGFETYEEAGIDLGAERGDVEQTLVLARAGADILGITIDGPRLPPNSFALLFRLLYDGVERSPDKSEVLRMARSYTELTCGSFGAIAWWLGQLTYVIEDELAEGGSAGSCREICLDVRAGLTTWGTAPGLCFVDWWEMVEVGRLVRAGAISSEAARARLLVHTEAMQMQKVGEPPPIRGELILNPLIDDDPLSPSAQLSRP